MQKQKVLNGVKQIIHIVGCLIVKIRFDFFLHFIQ